ncbi:Uncharacterised protein [Zhongshania aliphaticivorans]|uniref:DUF1415 domain-containing protein n=1 Tax=Zhongshania aliphaticivorans TaxID=1470434 RepID=A0A5S9N182_9GAMM|nr:DUF1415 domain-containing protein [Zhongshania aliphaticivorans]CAA0082734.1 Uncharacterised protein [Zhongshania aliphaticivorans]CAA0084048.1 Uncharacterised protein [Zhongshania aliphaticivorans]
MTTDIEKIRQDIQLWLNNAVIGLGLCPFAAKPLQEDRVAIEVSCATTPEDLVGDLHMALCRLEETPLNTLETSLVVVPNMLQDFYDYNDFLEVTDAVLQEGGWDGEIQIASFHPDYQFGGTAKTDFENFTNRAPYPIFHLLREDSLEQAIAAYPNPEAIPERNIALLREMDRETIAKLFPYCFN